MEKAYRWVPLFFVLILVLAPIGFRKYLFALFGSDSQHFYLHFHALFMTVWCGILILQPILILKGRMELHKCIGRISYVLVPILVLSIFMMLYHSLLEDGVEKITRQGILGLFFPFTQILIFGTFYLLAIRHVKSPRRHMRYILVSSVSLLGPTIGRMDFSFMNLPDWNWDLLVMEFALIAFLLWDTYKSKKGAPYIYGLLSFLFVHLLITFKFEESRMWLKMGGYLSKLLIYIF